MRSLAQVFTIVVLFLTLLTAPAALLAQETFLPKPTGPYSVGTTLRHWIDEARRETYLVRDPADKRSDQRELMVQLWYPAEVPEGAVISPYLPGGEPALQAWNETFGRFGSSYVMPVEVAQAPTHAYIDVPVAQNGAPFPVLVFSPGIAAPPIINQAQFEELASHGYVIAAIYHTYNASATIFPDGQVIIGTADQSISPNVWSADQSFVLDQLTAINADDPEGLFTGKFNVEVAGVFGMSYGGYASALTMSKDDRFRAGVDQDGYFEGALARSINRPMLFMTSDDAPPITDFRVNQLQPDGYMLHFDGFQHATFSDCTLWPGNEDTSGVVYCSADPVRAIPMLNAYILGFFDKYLKGETVPLFDGPSSDYPEVEFHAANDA